MNSVSLPNLGLRYRVTKRLIDLVVASLLLVLLSPLYILAAFWVKMDSSGPIYYRAPRVGWHGRTFFMLKFRTMVVNADKLGGPTTAERDPRLTKAGRWLRRLKIDELPQVLNVLGGSMSLVGPRPDVPSEAAKLSLGERTTILGVRPGMTDWASLIFYREGEIVSGSADPHAAYERLIRPGKLALQMHYARTASTATDARILWHTFRRLMGGSVKSPIDVSAPQERQTAPEQPAREPHS